MKPARFTLLPALALLLSPLAQQVAHGYGFCGCASCAGLVPNEQAGDGDIASPFRLDPTNPRWFGSTASGTTGFRGDPMTLTWGFAREGATIAGRARNGGPESTADPNSLISALNTQFGAPTTSGDLTTAPWFSSFNTSYNRWSQLSGLTMIYEPNDDGATMGREGADGVLGTRADMRIGGRNIDGASSILAYNYLPNNGDMVIDTSDLPGVFSDNLAFRNMIMHEVGHGLGFLHLESSDRAFLMEPFISTDFDGPQLDDILAVQRMYGDALEKSGGNNTVATATSLGNLTTTLSIGDLGNYTAIGASQTDFISIDGTSDIDFFSFAVSSAGTLGVTLTPRGATYNEGPEDGAQTAFNTKALANLMFEIYGTDGSTHLGTASGNAAGVNENSGLSLNSSGTYFVRVSQEAGSANNVQLYGLALSFSLPPPGGNFWDSNGNATGSDNTGGAWSQSKWTADPAGNAATGTFTAGTTPTFSAGSNATGTFVVSVNTNANVAGITFQEGNVTLSNGGGTLTLTAPTIDVASGLTAIIAAPLAGTVGLQKTGIGTLTLTNANTYTGTTTVSGGVLNLNAPAPTVLGNLIMNGGDGTFVRTQQANQFGAGSVANFASGAGAWNRFELFGNNQTLAGINTGNSTTLGGGVIQNSEVNGAAGSAATLTLNGSGSYLFHGHLRDYGNPAPGVNKLALVKEGTGTQTLAGNMITYSGTTTVSGGTLELLNTNGFASAATVGNGATLLLTNTTNQSRAAAASITLDNGATLTHQASTNGNGFLVLAGAVTVSGNTTINQNSVTNTTGANKSLFLDGGLKGTGTVTINALNPGNAVVFRNNNTTFSGRMIVNGIASTTVNAGSGIAVGGNTTGLTNADITLNGTMELLNQGIGWAANAPGDFAMGALDGNGVMVGNFSGGGTTRVRIGNTNNNGHFSGTIANGTGNVIVLTKLGTGTQTLEGAGITYTGNTTVNGGTLVLARTNAFASGTTTINPGATLELNSTNVGVDNWRINTILAGSGTINKTGSGWVQTFTNAHTFSGTVNIQQGTFGTSFLNSNWTGVTADFNISPGALLDARGQAITVGSLNGGGIVGTTWTSPATVIVGAGDKSGTFAGSIRGNSSTGTNNPANPNAGVLSLVKIGTGTQILSGNNTFTGSITVNGGVLRGSSVGAFGASNNARTITVNSGATLEFNANGVFGGHATANMPSLIINGGTVTNTSGNNPLNNITLNNGTITATASNSATWRSWNINGTITSTGTSTISGGTAPNPGIMLASGTPTNTNFDVQSGTLTVAAAIVDGRAAASPFTARATSLTKTGAGTMNLTEANTYTGGTLVSGGTLLINNSSGSGTGSGPVIVSAGATLGGSGTIAGDATIYGTHSPGNSPGIITHSNLTYASDITGSPNVIWELIGNTTAGRGTNFDGINVNGDLDFAGPTALDLVFNLSGSSVDWSDQSFWSNNFFGTDGWLLYDVSGTTSNFGNLSINSINWQDGNGALFNNAPWGKNFGLHLDGSDIYLIYTPEPSKAILLALGLIGLLARRRR